MQVAERRKKTPHEIRRGRQEPNGQLRNRSRTEPLRLARAAGSCPSGAWRHGGSGSPAPHQNFPNLSVTTALGPLNFSFVVAGEVTPLTYR